MTDFLFFRRIVVIGAVSALAGVANAQGGETAARAMIAQWAGSSDTDAFLRQPAVHAQLQQLLGAGLRHLERNLNVKGSIDLVGGVLSVSGNASHRGTEEEAVVCVQPPGTKVEAAILSQGTITVFTRAEKYEYTTLCIKDWVTLANSGHVDRLRQPANVRVARPP